MLLVQAIVEQVDNGQEEPLLSFLGGHEFSELSLTSPRPALALLRLHYLEKTTPSAYKFLQNMDDRLA